MIQLSKYKAAWEAYLKFIGTSKSTDAKVLLFINKMGLKAMYRKTDVVNPNFEGTCNISIQFSDKFKTALNKKNRTYSYYGLKSLEDAKAKLYSKCFEFIDIYLTQKPYFEQKRVIS